MARLLLGVSGGIAAYKALETARLAVKAGHAVRVIQTDASQRFVGRASFEAITGAPVLISEFEPDPARGSYPGEPPAERAPISHLALVERADLYLIAPASANTIAKLAHGHADNLLTHRGARRRVSGRRGAGDEQPDVSAPGDAGQPRAARCARGDGDPAGGGRARPPTASTGSAGCAEPPSCSRRARRC